MKIIDTHSHIYLPEFDNDRQAVLARATTLGITRIYMPAIDSSTHGAMLNLEKDYPETCRAMMGLHPCSVKENAEEELVLVKKYLDSRPFAAIGETGLDYYWDLSFKDQQQEAFRRQLVWARELKLPVVIHSRESLDDCIKLVREEHQGTLTGIFHCFSGTAAQAAAIAELGFFMGIGGVVTFKNGGLDKLIPSIPLENMLLETDAPYLAPVPYRGKRNEPAYLAYVLDKLASLTGLAAEEVAAVTTSNAEKLFTT